MKNSIYFQRANLLLQLLPFVSEEEDFALKGGTAINFFNRDLPRLSVDIDLCYLPLADRESSLNHISESLQKISNRVTQVLPNLKLFQKKDKENKNVIALIVNKKDLIVKIEPNPVLRGAIHPVKKCELVLKAQALFEQSISLNCLSFADLYGGKICAALDRQHPRDLFDVKLLLENEGITDKIRKASIVYLISHPRPIVELLKPNVQDITSVFTGEFQGMTLTEITLDELEKARERLIKQINESLTDKERRFLLSFKKMEPEWDLLDLDRVEELPAVKWKLMNLEHMDKKKHGTAVEKLKKHLQV